MHFPSFFMLISSACQKDKLPCCALKHFLPQSSAKRLFHDTSKGTFRIINAYQESIIASFEDIWQANFLKMLTNVDHDNLRTVLLQAPNTSHSYPF